MSHNHHFSRQKNGIPNRAPTNRAFTDRGAIRPNQTNKNVPSKNRVGPTAQSDQSNSNHTLNDLWADKKGASPAKKRVPAAAKKPGAKQRAAQSLRGLILVVDDSPTIRKLVSISLKKHGYQVIPATDGIDGLSKINDRLPDLILLDITMPRLDGYQLCKIIKGNKETKHIPVIMLSGKDGFFDKVRGRMAGSTDYITKPCKPNTLLQVVTKHINQPNK